MAKPESMTLLRSLGLELLTKKLLKMFCARVFQFYSKKESSLRSFVNFYSIVPRMMTRLSSKNVTFLGDIICSS